MVALVGPSGSGKSTPAALLLRFLSPESGRILLDGDIDRNHSIRELAGMDRLGAANAFPVP